MSLDLDQLRLTDFMDAQQLQEIQDGFATIAQVKAVITDDQGNPITQPSPTREYLKRQEMIAQSDQDAPGPQRDGAVYSAPIVVLDRRVGTIRMSTLPGAGPDEAKLLQWAQKFGLDVEQVKSVSRQVLQQRNNKPAAIQFLFLLANAIARLCFQEFQLRQRIDELTAVYNTAMMLAEARELPKMLLRTVDSVCELMQAKAGSIRLVDRDRDELVIRAVHNLSDAYLAKGPIRLSQAVIDRVALSQKGYEYVADMATDPRVLFPTEAKREGFVSMLSVGMRYKGKPIGVLRVYYGEQTTLSPWQISLLRAVATQAAAAIENARLLQETIENQMLERQLALAVDVQRRMVPDKPPAVKGMDLASIYEPYFGLGGDLFDFIELPEGNLGLVVADVSGKGLPASLIMASVRASLRAHVYAIYELNEVIHRVNAMLCQDTKPGEFVTLFYGVVDTVNHRLTWCNAGHPPAMLLRDGQVTELSGDNLILGIDPNEPYHRYVLDLKPGDTLLLYTDGLTDMMNFEGETFGKERLLESFRQGGPTAQAIAQRLLWEQRRFSGLNDRIDDTTLIVARIT